jgi:hypothetical protein
MRVACGACACVSFVMGVSLQSAEARIRASDSEILAGLLVVAGRTEHPGETITLDGKFTAVSARTARTAATARLRAVTARSRSMRCAPPGRPRCDPSG